MAQLGGWSEEAVLRVVGDFADGLLGLGLGVGFGEVEAGDLEAVEHDAGAARIDLVGGHAAQDFADGVLDSAAILGVGKGEAPALARAGVLDGTAGVVVVVAEVFRAVGATEGGAAAAAAVGEDVAALVDGFVGVGGEVFGCHGVLRD